MKRILLALLAIAGAATAADTTLINGAGATFPFPIYSKWFSEYNKAHPNVQINYQSIGSGGGIKQHLDTSGPEAWGTAHHHGTPFRHALAEGLIAPGRLVQVGLRATWGKLSDPEVARAYDARQVAMDEIEQRGIAAVAREVRERLGGGPVYVSFDVDAIDPAFAPGTGTPVPGGMTSREAFHLLRALKGVKLAGMDLVEVCPALDHADITSHLGAHLLFEGLALLA